MQQENLRLFSDNYILVRGILKNIGKYNLSHLTSEIIKKKIDLEIQAKFPNAKVLRVEFKTAEFDTYGEYNYQDSIVPEQQYNNWEENEFLQEIFGPQCLKASQLLESMKSTNSSTSDHLNFSDNEQENINDITKLDAEQQSNKNNSQAKVSRFEKINTFIKELQKFQITRQVQTLNNIQKIEIDDKNLSKSDSPLLIVFSMPEDYKEKMNNFKFRLEDKGDYVFINFENAQIFKDEIQRQEYSIKMGKQLIELDNLELSYLLGEYLEDKKLNIPNDYPITHNLYPYFQFIQLKGIKTNIEAQMYYHNNDSLLSKKIEFIINFFGKLLLKIDLDFANCQFCTCQKNNTGRYIYFKLLSPPLYSVSFVSKKKFELFNIKSDWVRVDNIFSNGYFAQYKNHIERLIMINNSVIKIQIKAFNSNSKEEFLYKKLIEKLKEFKLLADENINFQYDINNRPTLIDQLNSQVEQANLPFEVKYNFYCLIGQNRITDLKLLQKIWGKIIEQLKPTVTIEQIDLIEQIFQSVLRFTSNLNLSHRISDLNNFNFLTFYKQKKKLARDHIFSSHSSKDLAMIKRVQLTPSGFIYNIKLPEETSTIIRQYQNQHNSFIRLHFEDENQETIHGCHYITDFFFKPNLLEGINLFNQKFQLLTWSASQLRGGSCWMMNFQSAELTRQIFIDSIGSFDKLQLDQVAKNAARLGQGFSSSKEFIFEQLNVNYDIEDLYDEDGKMYTDGVGQISRDLIQQIRSEMKNETISAIQIRFHGAKGILVLNNDLPQHTIVLRKSQIKYQPSKSNDCEYTNTIALLDYNKFRGGYLNRQVIILLITLGIDNSVFIKLQNDYLEQIKHLSAVDSSIYKHFSVDYNGELQGLQPVADCIRDMINCGMNEDNNFYVKNVLARLKRRGLMQLRTKCNILVDKAARVLGIVDEFNLLNENEVICIVQKDRKEPEEYLQGEIIVVRNPCLHPGDIRKVKALSRQEIQQRQQKNNYSEYFNCIVFPSKGKSIPPQCGGGDLDGDIYFVSWDEKLIPKQIDEPMIYDEEKKPEQKEKIQRFNCQSSEDFFKQDKMIDFILQYLNYDTLGKIDNSHLAFADQSIDYARDKRCLDLAKLHSAAVDYVKHGFKQELQPNLISKTWPDFMEKENKLIQYESQTVLGQLYRDVQKLTDQSDEQDQIAINNHEISGLPPIKQDLLFHFPISQDDELTIGEESLIQKVEVYIEQSCVPYLKQSLECLNHIFDSFNSVCKIFDINNEYEIYTGYFTNFTKGEGTRLKRKLNIDTVQKRVIQQLIQIKDEIKRMIGEEYKNEIISLMHFFMCYSPKSNKRGNSKSVDQFIEQLTVKISQLDDIALLKSRLEIRFQSWYRGCTWFFFYKDILQYFALQNTSEMLQEQHQDNDDNTDMI